MSQTELHIGTMKAVPLNTGENLEDQMQRIMIENKIAFDDEYPVKEEFEEHMNEKYFVHKGIIFKLDNKAHDPNDGICKAELKDDGSISYILQFYNGGTCFPEMMEDALDKIL